MITIEQLRIFTESCQALAEKFPDPYRTQALSVIGKKQNWPAKFEKITQKLSKELEVQE
jgi:hypothetical protein